MLNAAYAGIRSALITNSAIMTALGATAVYTEAVPPDAPYPYIVLQEMAGGDQNIYAQAAADMVIMVKYVGPSGQTGGAIAGMVRDLLHEGTAVSMGTAWDVYRVRHQTVVSISEYVDRKWIYHKGANYRVQAVEIG